MADRHDENLPEVVPDSSPQPLTYAEAYERRGLDEGEQKYTVIYDLNTPKIATSVPVLGAVETPTTPAPAYRPPVDGAAGAFAADAEKTGAVSAAENGGPKILGLKRRTFFIILITAVIIISVAIGGGIGGSLAAKQRASGEEGAARVADEAGITESSDAGSSDTVSSATASSADGSSATKSSTTESSATSTKTSSASPSSTSGGGGGSGSDDDDDDEEEEEEDDDDDDDNNGDDRPKPGFEFRGWKDANFKGQSTDIIATTGFLDLPFDVTSYKWQPKGTDCCVTMCQGTKKSVGWRCTSFNRDKATANFGRIFIGCGAEASEDSSRCS